MRKKQNYLTKKFKGKYIEKLQEFLVDLDADWNWKMSMYINYEHPPKVAFAKMFCENTGNLILVRLAPIEKKVSDVEMYYRFVVEKVGERTMEDKVEPSHEDIPKLFQDEELL